MSARALCWWLVMAFCADGVLVAASVGSGTGLGAMSGSALVSAAGYTRQRRRDRTPAS